MTNGRCRMRGGASPGAPVGNTNAFKHGLFTAAAIAERREAAALIREMKGLVEQADGQDWTSLCSPCGFFSPTSYIGGQLRGQLPRPGEGRVAQA